MRPIFATALIATVLLLMVALVTKEVINRDRQVCRAQNRTLDVVESVLQAQVDAPHRFNEPSDIKRRSTLLAQEKTKIRDARCL